MRKKMFTALFLAVFLVFSGSYFLIYFMFHNILHSQLQQQQLELLQYNQTIFQNYFDYFDMIPFQMLNDEKIGEAINTDSGVYLDLFRARESLRRNLNNYLKQYFYATNINCRLSLFLNDAIPLSASCPAGSLSDRYGTYSSYISSNIQVSDLKWYRRATQAAWSHYFFYNQETGELCYAQNILNYYTDAYTSDGLGVIVFSIPSDVILEKLSLRSVTSNSSFLILNEDREILYSQGPDVSSQLTDDVFLSQPPTQLRLAKEEYLLDVSSAIDDLYLIFLTPESDIEAMARMPLRSYILFAAFALLLLAGILSVLSYRITAPVISFANLLEKIDDTRSFDTSLLSGYKDRELKILCRSFRDLIGRENTLIQQIDEEHTARQKAVLHALQAQINHHFLYNALYSASWMALNKHEDAIADVLSSISNLMHYSISHPDTYVPLSQELQNIQDFIQICCLEYPIEIYLHVSASDDSLPEQLQIPKFILQPLIENAVLHNTDLPLLHISVNISASLSEVFLTITDDGTGADPAKLNAFLSYEQTDLTVSSGFGIRNVNERIRLNYPEPSGLSYTKNTDGHLTAQILLVTAS